MLFTPQNHRLSGKSWLEGLAAVSVALRSQFAEDNFELALAVDALVLAFERRTAGRAVHRPVDARCLVVIASMLELSTLPQEISFYERILELQRLLEQLSGKRRSELIDAVVDDYRRTPWRPMRGSQCAAYELACEVDVLLLAGGAASGKTEVAIAIAMFQSRASRFIRKTSLEFGPILKRIGEITGTTDGRNLASQTWTLASPYGFGNRGATLEFSGMNDPDAMLRLQGRPVDCLVVDDVGSGQVAREEIEFVSRWLRSVEQVPKKLILPSNPPTSSDSLWLRDDWFRPWLCPDYEHEHATSGETRYFAPNADGDGDHEVPANTPDAQSRSVVFSTVEDNPRLLRTGYQTHLAQTPSVTLRRRLLENDWTAGFDEDDDLQVIPGAWVDAAMLRWTPEPPAGLDAIGIDVARGGKDRTTLIRRHDTWYASPIVKPGRETRDGQTVAALALGIHTKGATIFIDVTGIGASPYDILREKVPTVGIIFGAGTHELDATQSFGFSNVRSLLWWRLRERLNPEHPRPVALPPDTKLKRELTMPRYELRGGKLFVESRDDVIKRLKASPDIATALVLSAIDTGSIMASTATSDLISALLRSNKNWRKIL